MRSVALAALLSLAFVGSAAAVERPAPRCLKIVEIKAKNPQAHFEVLGAGAYHFVAGVYAGQPPVGVMPPGDGAILVTEKGKHGAEVIWTRHDEGCEPFLLPEELARSIPGIKTAKDEKFEPGEDSKGDVHL